MGNVLFEGFWCLVFLFFLVFTVIRIPILTTIYFQLFVVWKSFALQIIYLRSEKYTFILDMSEILDNIYIWMYLVKSKSVLFLVFVIYRLNRFALKTIFCFTFWRLKTCFVTNNCSKSSYICVFILSKK